MQKKYTNDNFSYRSSKMDYTVSHLTSPLCAHGNKVLSDVMSSFPDHNYNITCQVRGAGSGTRENRINILRYTFLTESSPEKTQ